MKPMTRLAAARPAPVPSIAGEQTQPLAVRIGAPIGAAAALPAPIAQYRLPRTLDVAPAAANDGTAYYDDGTRLSAFDLTRGAIAWHRTVQLLDDTLVAGTGGVGFAQRYPAPSLFLDAKTGEARLSMKDTYLAGTAGGMLFGKNNDQSSYFALDAATGERRWGTYGGGMQIAGAPHLRDGMLLQRFVTDGAIAEDALYAFDPSNGHPEWNTPSNTPPLGFHGDLVYVDSTWFPDQLDRYVPLTVAAVDIRTGKPRSEFTYAPDPLQNAATYRNAQSRAYVSGGFVYLEVNGTWYRYDADHAPAAAHPSRILNLDVGAAFDSGVLLVHDARRAYVAIGSEHAMTLHALPGGALASPIARDADGAAYFVAGSVLYRLGPQGDPRALGAVRCAAVNAVLPWPGRVAVMCGRRELLFGDALTAAARPWLDGRQ